ncbi:MAG: ATP-binding cassette domain-containing protein [Alphaproteobacteria bacterium]|nr:ATP-binding cassette domain-containing protein [Alphaproteobacteria bacterium]
MRSSRSSSMSSASDVVAPVVRVRSLMTSIGGRILVRDATFDLRPGEVLGVVGASGSGKSVLLRTIVGLVPAAAGAIEIFGDELGRSGQTDLRRFGARWGVLFQDGALFSSLTVAENIMVPLREQLHLSPALMHEIAALKIALVGLPPDTADKFPAALSGGMRKRAGLARALALDPKLLFLDEPTAGLDPIAATEFDGLVRDLKESLGLTVFMVTHDLDSLIAICDRIAVIVDQRVVIGTLAELMRNPHPWIQAYFRGPRGRAAQVAEAANG